MKSLTRQSPQAAARLRGYVESLARERKKRRRQALAEEKRRREERREEIRRMEGSLAEFTRGAWHVLEPSAEYVDNWHIRALCGYLEAFFRKDIKRLILNVPPGSMKSLLFSVFGPAWTWTQSPGERFINITNEIGLAGRDCHKMRLLVESDWYQERWGHKVQLQPRQNEKLFYENTAMGFRQGAGMGGNITGKRGSFLLIDDPHDAKKAFSDVLIQNATEFFDQAVSSRLNSLEHDCIGIIMQRLRTNDMTGHVLTKKATKWVHVAIPMEYDGVSTYDAGRDLGRPELNDPRSKPGELMFPARFPKAAVESLKEDLGEYGTAGQLQQRPVPLSGGILKAKWWQTWPKDKPLPDIQHVFLSWDTAYTTDDLEQNAFSAFTKWGVFEDADSKRQALLLLDAWWRQVDFPDLLGKAKEEQKKARQALPETATMAQLIEKKASGISLVQTLRKEGIRVRTYLPDRDKIARAYAVQPMFQAGRVWIPERKWAEAVVGFVASFPKGAPPSADLTDTVTQACLYVKQGWWLRHPDDDEPPDEPARPRMAEDDDDDDSPNKQGMIGLYG